MQTTTTTVQTGKTQKPNRRALAALATLVTAAALAAPAASPGVDSAEAFFCSPCMTAYTQSQDLRGTVDKLEQNSQPKEQVR